MGLPWVLVDNLGSLTQYPNHTVTGDQEPAGTEAYRAFDGRRSQYDYWSPSTVNADHYLQIVCDRVRAADCIVLDRGHTLAGYTVNVQGSDDSFATVDTVTCVVPAVSGTGASIDDANGVLTEEGAWVKRFPLRAHTAWRIDVPAMGAALVPVIVGCWLGKHWAPASAASWQFNLPLAQSGDADTLQGREQASEAGWVGRGQMTPRREGEIPLKLVDLMEYDLARLHLQQQFGAGRPMWVGFDDAAGERAFLAIRPLARFGFTRQAQWFFPQALVPYEEHEPLRA